VPEEAMPLSRAGDVPRGERPGYLVHSAKTSVDFSGEMAAALLTGR
jgi:hypothetical protein